MSVGRPASSTLRSARTAGCACSAAGLHHRRNRRPPRKLGGGRRRDRPRRPLVLSDRGLREDLGGGLLLRRPVPAGHPGYRSGRLRRSGHGAGPPLPIHARRDPGRLADRTPTRLTRVGVAETLGLLLLVQAWRIAAVVGTHAAGVAPGGVERVGWVMSNGRNAGAAGGGAIYGLGSSGPWCTSGSRPTASGSTCWQSSRACSGRRS